MAQQTPTVGEPDRAVTVIPHFFTGAASRAAGRIDVGPCVRWVLTYGRMFRGVDLCGVSAWRDTRRVAVDFGRSCLDLRPVWVGASQLGSRTARDAPPAPKK